MERFFLSIISGKQLGGLALCLKGVLRFLSWLYAPITIARNFCFDKGWRKVLRPHVPVISIGNLVAGGTGKTPLTLSIAQELLKASLRVGIVLRGYRSPAEQGPPLAVSLGDGPIYPAQVCGDEAVLLARYLPRALVFVGANKQASLRMAIENGAEVILLDDGFQHRAIHRNLDLVVLDASNLFGYGAFLPRGLLRECVHSLSRADFVVVNHVTSDEMELQVKRLLAKYTLAPVLTTCYKVKGLCELSGEPTLTPDGPVALVSGIGSPEHFFESAASFGLKVADRWELGDHLAPQKEKLLKKAWEWKDKGVCCIVCTEKDSVKWPDIVLPLPVFYLQVELTYRSGKELLDRGLRTIFSDIAG